MKREGRRTGRRVKRLGVSGRRPLGLGGVRVREKDGEKGGTEGRDGECQNGMGGK